MRLILLLALAGCATGADSSGDSAGEPACDTADTAEPGVLGVQFVLDADLVDNMEEPPVGAFHGSIFAEDQATATGPIDGAVSMVDFQVDLDFTTSTDPTAVLWTSDPWPPQKLWVLGCLDSDANDCDKKDPITVPNTNKFLLASCGETDVTVNMELLSP